MKKIGDAFMKKDKFDFRSLNLSDKKQVKMLALVIVMTCIVLIGTSYAWFIVSRESVKQVSVVAGTLDLSYNDSTGNTITLVDQVPISDEDGLTSTGYTFEIRNTGNIETEYSIYLDNVDLASGEVRLDDRYVKYSLTKNNATPSISLVNGLTNGVLDSGKLGVGITNTYTLRVWLDENNFNSDATSKTFKKTLRVEASQVTK